MGLTITSRYAGALDLDGGYGMLLRIRQIVALAFDEEFGKHYATLIDCHSDEDYKAFDIKANRIIKDERFKEGDEDILDFLFSSDCEGSIKYRTCKKIYDLIKDDNRDIVLRYTYYSKNDWNDFKTLLKGCYSHRANLVWW